MRVCSNCFSDQELKAFIISNSKIADCDVCPSIDSHSINISELTDFFQELLDCFMVSEDGLPIKNKIIGDWGLFNSHQIASKILDTILPNISTHIHSSESLVQYTEDITDNTNHWETLKKELKWSRRFIFDFNKLEDLGWDGFFNTQYMLDSEEHLYRGRVHHKSGVSAYDFDSMSCPPAHLVKGGRANPSGIPYLYLSDNNDTVLYEVRASYLDEISVASFRLFKKFDPIPIVDFTENSFLFQPVPIDQTIKSQLLRKRISQDLSRPMRRYDSEIDYVPTQFICEYIRVVTGAQGIRFKSSLDPTGKNIVIFDETIMECIDVKLSRINKVHLSALEI